MATSSSDDADDDMSVATAQTGNRHISNAGEEKEYVIKFLFRPKGGNNNTEVARTHYAILRAIADIYPEVQIYDNYGASMKEFPQIKIYDAYLCHYKLQFVKANENKSRKAIYLVFHRIVSPVLLSETRRHATVSALLQCVNTRLSLHHWPEDDTRIANLGFFVGIDPSNLLQEEMIEHVRQHITAAMKCAVQKIPRFCCGYSSPFSIDSNGHRITTKAYNLQCRQQDAKDLLTLLQCTYHNNPIFMFHRICHSHPEVYRTSIRQQNSFLSTSQVIPVQGISEDVMFYVSSKLRVLPGVLDIAKHKFTSSKGCWNIFTNEAHFKQLTSTIKDKLPPLVALYCNEHNLNLSCMPPDRINTVLSLGRHSS